MAAERKTRATINRNKTAAPAPARIAAYLRVSTQDQADSGLGLAAQEKSIRAMCALKGWGDAVLYVDSGVSGTKESRPQFDLLRAAIVAGQLDALIVASLDRLGRRTRIILDIVELCARYGVALLSIKESFDTSTPAGQFAVTLFAGLAQMERDTIALRTTEALDARGDKYDYKAGLLPLGYVRRVELGNVERIEIDASGAAVVRSIFDLHRRGRSLREIAASLNKRGIPARRGGEWKHSAVQTVLGNRALYQGKHDAYPALLGAKVGHE